MRNFDEHNITSAVLERRGAYGEPARSRGVGGARAASARFHQRDRADLRGMGSGHQVSDRRRPQMHFVAAGVHSSCPIRSAPPCWSMRSIIACPRAPPRRRCSGRSSSRARRTRRSAPTFPPASPASRCSSRPASPTPKASPLAGAVVDVWHSDKDGYYDVQHYDEGGEMSLRARFRTDAVRTRLALDDRAVVLPDSRRWAGRRHAARAGPSSLPPGARPFHDRRARLRDAGHAYLHRRRQISRACPHLSQASAQTSCNAARKLRAVFS